MGVLGVHGVVLEVPDLAIGRKFYTDAGLECRELADRLQFHCPGQRRDAITLIQGSGRKRLHHLVLAMDPTATATLRANIDAQGGRLVDAPSGFDEDGIWLEDPHAMLIHLVDSPAEVVEAVETQFEINQAGHVLRRNRAAMRRKADVPEIQPLRLGHILLFTPDTMASVNFFDKALGMGLADRAEDVIAFMCSRHGSDHHVVAFAKGGGVGFHHASFQVRDPDEVGVGGDRLVERSGRGSWGFGRHTIGSNFFYYIQDPWGSWMEYYCDIDYVENYDAWNPTVYGMEDSLHHWGPAVPHDFVHNYEIAEVGFAGKVQELAE